MDSKERSKNPLINSGDFLLTPGSDVSSSAYRHLKPIPAWSNPLFQEYHTSLPFPYSKLETKWASCYLAHTRLDLQSTVRSSQRELPLPRQIGNWFLLFNNIQVDQQEPPKCGGKKKQWIKSQETWRSSYRCKPVTWSNKNKSLN